MNKLYCGDTLAILKEISSNSIDVGVTSPPYNKGENKKGWLVDKVVYDTASDKKNEAEYQLEQISVLNEIYRVMKAGSSFFYNHKVRWDKGVMIHPMEWLLKTQWTIRQEIVWDRMIASNIRGWRFWQTEERIYWLYKPVDGNKIGEELKSKHALLTSVWRIPPEQHKKHPAQFPLVIPLRCIYSVIDDKKGVVVLDPYCGSGTTLVASKLLGHQYIGIDISEAYIKIAEDRLENYLNEQLVADSEIGKHTVIKTFKDRKAQGNNVGKFRIK